MSDSVSVAEFARLVNRTDARIHQLLKAKRIPRNPDKSIPIKEGLEAWAEIQKANEAREALNPKKVKALPEDDETPPLGGSSQTAMNITTAFNKARLAEKTFQAKLKEIEYKLKKGELVESSTVREIGAKTASALITRLRSLPTRTAGMCEGRTAREIEEILDAAIGDVVTEFHRNDFVSKEALKVIEREAKATVEKLKVMELI